MTIEIVSFPMKNCGSFNSYVKLPEGNNLVDFPSHPLRLSPASMMSVHLDEATRETLDA